MNESMKQIWKIIMSFFLILFLISWNFQPTHAAILNNKLYVDLSPKSSSQDVKKFQNMFSDLKIYKWPIDGNFITFIK